MSDAPERIWANFRNWRNPHEGHCYKHDDLGGDEYVRADLVDALVSAAKREALMEAAEFIGGEAKSFPDNVAWAVEDLAKHLLALAAKHEEPK